MKQDNIIQSKSFQFSLQMIAFYKVLAENKEFVISKQVLRSSTSIGANVEEAIAAQSKKDSIAKMSIASKEARETRYWLRLLNESQFIPEFNYSKYLADIEEIINILTAIVKTSQSHL